MLSRLDAVAVLALFIAGTVFIPTAAVHGQDMAKRVPAEWEPQEAIWLQWPGVYEKSYEAAFAEMAKVIVRYEKLHVLHNSETIRADARAALIEVGADPDHPNLLWHAIANDNAWMRDNGPVYVVDDNGIRLQSWEFDAWGGAFGSAVMYERDNRVPQHVGDYLNLPVDHINIVHERGNLEFNGVDTVILNWSTLGDPKRNPGYTQTKAETDLKRHFGVHQIVFVEGVPEGDLTNGHIDGIARFINPSTVVVPQCKPGSNCFSNDSGTSNVFDNAAATIEQAGFEVVREPIEHTVTYKGESFDTNYMNWIVGNGFVIAVGFEDPTADAPAKTRIEKYFPGRDVYVIGMLESWYAGVVPTATPTTSPQPKRPANRSADKYLTTKSFNTTLTNVIDTGIGRTASAITDSMLVEAIAVSVLQSGSRFTKLQVAFEFVIVREDRQYKQYD